MYIYLHHSSSSYLQRLFIYNIIISRRNESLAFLLVRTFLGVGIAATATVAVEILRCMPIWGSLKKKGPHQTYKSIKFVNEWKHASQPASQTSIDRSISLISPKSRRACYLSLISRLIDLNLTLWPWVCKSGCVAVTLFERATYMLEVEM